MTDTVPSSLTRRRLRRKRVLIASLTVVVLLVAACAAMLIPRSDSVGEIDAVIALGGGSQQRVGVAAELADERDVSVVLSSSHGFRMGERIGRQCTMTRVVCLTPEPSTTAGEAAGMLALADEHGWDRVAVITESFHANRSRMLFRQCFGDRVDVVGTPTSTSFSQEVHRTSRELTGRIAGATVARAC